MLVQKLDMAKIMKSGSLSRLKSNISVRVSIVSLWQGIQPHTIVSSSGSLSPLNDEFSIKAFSSGFWFSFIQLVDLKLKKQT